MDPFMNEVPASDTQMEKVMLDALVAPPKASTPSTDIRTTGYSGRTVKEGDAEAEKDGGAVYPNDVDAEGVVVTSHG